MKLLRGGFALAVVLFARLADAQSSSEDRALATALFEEARALVSAGDWAAACPKFAESQRLEPAPGTLLNLASCHEHEGKVATAWAEYVEALAIVERERQPERVAFARERIDALVTRIPRLVIVVPSSESTRSLTVLRDGSTLARVALGTAMPVDPGTHHIEVRGEGIEPWSIDVALAEGERREVSVGPFVASLVPAPSPTPPASPPIRTDAPVRTEERSRTPMWIAGGIGIAGLATGSIAGILAIDASARSKSRCSPRCDDEGWSLNDTAKTEADVATVAFSVALVAGVVTAVLFLTSR